MSGFRDRLRESGSALADVFRNPALRRLQLAFIGSTVGDRAFTVAIAVYAYAQGGASAVGIVAVIRYLAMAVSFPLASTLADRHSRRRVMLLSDLACATFALVGAAVVAMDGPPVLVYALVIATSVAATCFRPAQAALLPVLARNPRELTAANVAASTIESVGLFAGPAFAGILLAFTNVQTVFVVNGISFLWSALFVLGLPSGKVAAHETREAPEAEGFVRHASAGFRAILGDRDLRLLIGLFCAQCVVAGASAVFIVTIGLDLLDIGQAGVGYLDAVVGIGGLVGGLVALVLAQRGRLAFDFGLGILLWALPLVAIAAWPTVGVAAAAMVLIGFGNSLVDINAYTIVQRAVPDAVMGRVFGAMESALIAAMAIGALLMPLLIATVGLRAGLAVIGAATGVLVVAGLTGLNRVDRTVLAPEGLELLRHIAIFRPLPEPIIERLARALIPIDVAAGAIVITEGEVGDRFYAIESGTVAVSKAGRWVADLGPGDFFGEIALLRDVPRTATVTASSDLRLQALEREVFIPAVTGHSDFAEAADTTMTARLAML